MPICEDVYFFPHPRQCKGSRELIWLECVPTRLVATQILFMGVGCDKCWMDTNYSHSQKQVRPHSYLHCQSSVWFRWIGLEFCHLFDFHFCFFCRSQALRARGLSLGISATAGAQKVFGKWMIYYILSRESPLLLVPSTQRAFSITLVTGTISLIHGMWHSWWCLEWDLQNHAVAQNHPPSCPSNSLLLLCLLATPQSFKKTLVFWNLSNTKADRTV